MKSFFARLVFALAAAMTAFFPHMLMADHVEESWAINRVGMQKAANGQIKEAIRDFERACQINPFNDAALANLACARNNLGVILAREKKYDEAIRQFESARAQKPEDISIRLNLLSTLVTLKDSAAVEREALQLLKLRPVDVEIILMASAALKKTENHSEALAVLERAAERIKDSDQLFLALGNMLYRQGNLAESRYYLNRSLEIAPDNAEATRLLDLVGREAAVNEKSRTFSSIHFSLSCHESFDEAWAYDLLDLLEEAYSLIGDRLDFYPSQRSQVMVMQTTDFRRVHDLPDWAGGLYDGRIRLPVPSSAVRISDMRGAVLHEYTHHVLFLKAAGKCPIWLNEGLAQVFEHGMEETYRYASSGLLERDFSKIDQLFRSSPDKDLAIELYRQSLGITARMIDEYGWPRVIRLLENLALGYDESQAALHALGDDLNEIAERWRQKNISMNSD